MILWKLCCILNTVSTQEVYVPQNGVQKNFVPHVPQIGVQFGVQIRVHWEKSQNLKSRGPGVKSTVNISKLEYFESFWMKIQKLKFFR